MRPPEIRIGLDELIVDSFAGGGGASLGIEMALGRSPDIAINHDPEAIAMHRRNHPTTKHYCEDVWKVDPVEACGGRAVGLAWFSPDCKHFSKAKGGKPVQKKIRGLAWVVVKWAQAVRPRVICLENVEEFADWGPLLEDGRPCPLRKGFTYRRWRRQLEKLGYKIDERELRACDYGTPTIRKRLFIVARRDGLPISWPEPTHGRGLLPYRTAAECIDWSIPCPSIFERARPLADNTLRRIAKGIQRYVIDAAEPFIVPYYGGGRDRAHSVDEPLRTQTVENRFGLVTPYVARVAHGERDKSGKKRGRGEHALTEPLPTVTASPEFSLITPCLARIGQTGGGGKYCNGVDEPVTTITSKGEHLLVSPTLIQTGYGERPGQAPRVPGLDKPLGTVVSGGKHALVAAFLAQHNTQRAGHHPGRRSDEPLSTITGRGTQQNIVTARLEQAELALEASTLVSLRGTHESQLKGNSIEAPLPTISAGGIHAAEVRAFLIKYYGQDQDPRLNEPMHTLTSRDRMGLVTVRGHNYYIADIGMRMLVRRELFRAQGFPDSYEIETDADGNPFTITASVRMCGNSVCPPIAAAVALAQFTEPGALRVGSLL